MNRRLVAAGLVACVLSACGSTPKAPSAGDVGDGVRSDAVTTPTRSSADGGAGADGGRGGAAAPHDTDPGSNGPHTGGSGGGDDGEPTPAPSPWGGPGTFAPAYLRADMTSSIVVELHSQAGASIGQTSLDHAMDELRTATGKRVEVVGPLPLETQKTSWSADDIRSTADAASRFDQSRERAVMRMLVLRGELDSNGNALAVAVRGDVLAIFSDKVSEGATVLSPRSRVEQAVVLHEVGHLLGLVDLFLHTGRQDADHPGHSRNTGSVMYWAIETTLVGQLLDGPPPVDFDAEDRADLAAIRNGAMG